ncbi:Protein CBG08672, partial [Caenorhabditis briggsae]
GETCMSVTFQVEILNEQNNNSVPIDFHLPSGVIKGKCAADRKSEAVISSTIEEADGRLKTLKFVFRTCLGSSAVFESDNSSVIFSAPLTQKYVCEDRINVTLHTSLFSLCFPLKSMFNPMVQRVIRTRKRTLSESLQHRSTVFCGVVLAISSIAHIVGHMLRRHFMPHRKELYENLDRLPAI